VSRSGILLGAVLAGGESRRFGSPKALARFHGEPLARRAARVLEHVCRRVAVVGRVDGLESDPRVTLIPDRVPGMGPLGGLHASLIELRDRMGDQVRSDDGDAGVFLLGCDMPLVDPALVRAVARVGHGCGRSAAAPAGEKARFEPLCAWYGLACLPEVEARLQGPDRSLHGLLDAVDAYSIPPARLGPGVNPGWALRSANTPERLAELEAESDGTGEGSTTPVPPALCVVGYKDSGKTGVSVGLVAELRRRGHRVAAVKHGHGFRLDTPGTDSWRLRHEGGADPVLLTGPEGFALMGSWEGREEPGVEDLLKSHVSGAKLVVVEGFKHSALPKVEVFRAARHLEPFFRSGEPGSEAVVAVVTDQPELEAPVPVLALDDQSLPARLADLVEEKLLR